MSLRFSDFGRRFIGDTGIGTLMRDLGAVPASSGPRCRLGGGNPARIDALDTRYREALRALANDAEAFAQGFGHYAGPAGHHGFVEALCDALNQRYGWSLGPQNVLLSNGSQNAFFMLFNLLAGPNDGDFTRILLPMAPEYIGYADVAIEAPFFTAERPTIELLADQQFKYRIDFERLRMDSSVAAMCVSRPTNPTGNVLSDEEIAGLDRLAREHRVPLVIDNAYGDPFPAIIHVPTTLSWNENIILSMSLSKIGLPAARTGILIAREEIIAALAELNAIMNLAPSSVAPTMLTPLLVSGELMTMANEIIRPWYRRRVEQALDWFNAAFADLPVRVHTPEGSIFFWLWFPESAFDSQQLYEALKARGVIVVPGHHFFPGLADDWPHSRQCLRVSIAGEENEVRQGLNQIASLIRELEKSPT